MARNPTPTPSPVLGSQGLSGVRGEFVASLGKRIAEARKAMGRAKGGTKGGAADPALADFARRVRSLANSARLFRFDAMMETLLDLEARIADPQFSRDDVDAILDRLPELAWTITPSRLPGAVATEGATLDPSIGNVVIGGETTAEVEESNPTESLALQEPASPDAAIDELLTANAPSERTDVAATSEETAPAPKTLEGIDVAAFGPFPIESLPFSSRRLVSVAGLVEAVRRHAPRVALLDGDLPNMDLILEEWMDDPEMESIPVIVAGTFACPGDASRFIALGATKTLAKPVDGPALLAAVGPLFETRTASIETFDAVKPSPPKHQISWSPDSTSVLGDISDTLSRIRALVAKPVPVRPKALSSLAAVAGTRHKATRNAQSHVSLEGRTIIVADHDPGIVWFLADVLRAQGAKVIEATDGAVALEQALANLPDLVLADILLPSIDGLELSRTLKGDIALRDVPVLLLSWKDDLPRRARELGATVDGFLRKESGEGVVLARVREALFSRGRFEDRLLRETDLKGRLDGLAPATLVRLVQRFRGDARLVIDDDVHTFEVHFRGSTPHCAFRFGPAPLEGRDALAALIALRSARFAILPHEVPSGDANLEGSIDELLLPLVSRARGAAHALAPHRLFSIERVELDLGAAASELATFPPSARAVVEALGSGMAMGQALRTFEMAPLGHVLTFLAWRGLVKGISFTPEPAAKSEAIPSREAELAFLFSARSPEPPISDAFPLTEVDTIYRVSELSPGTALVSEQHHSNSDIPIVLEQPMTPLAGEVAKRSPERRDRKGLAIGAGLVAIALLAISSPSVRESIAPATAVTSAPVEAQPVLPPAPSPITPLGTEISGQEGPIAVSAVEGQSAHDAGHVSR